MTIKELKTQIENNAVTHDLIILKDTQDNFLSSQYIHAIAKAKNQQLNYVEDIQELLADYTSIFGVAQPVNSALLNVIKSDVFIWVDDAIAQLNNVIIVVHKFASKELEAKYEQYIVTIPNIETWMMQDYVYSIAEGADKKQLEWLMNLCGTNYHRLQQELDKLLIFREDERKYLLSDLINDGAMEDLSANTIFDFTNAILARDLPKLKAVYSEISRIDVEPLGLLTILLKNFKNYVTVRLTNNPTPQSTGMTDKQIYAIKRASEHYTSTQLLGIYEFLLDLDRKLKSGELPESVMIDYIVTKILSM